MRISSVTLTNFRSFGPTAEAIRLGDLTALVGTNSSGKSAALCALARLFGMTKEEKSLTRSDFHLPLGSSWDDVTEANLSIEARLDFPELVSGRGGDPAAACFRQMTIQAPGTVPYVRIRLEGKWRRSSNPDGDIEESLKWVTSPIGTPPDKEKTSVVLPHDRSKIQVRYVPASRDPAKQIRQVSGSLLHSLLRAVDWSDGVKGAVTAASDTMRSAFGGERGVSAIEKAMGTWWVKLHGAAAHRDVTLRPAARSLEDLLRQVEATFSPGTADGEEGMDRLSDGQKSLFYLSIVGALLDIQGSAGVGFSSDRIERPVLTMLAIEEPENHVSPHYLGRIVKTFRGIAGAERGQVVFSSHSPSVLSRVDPREVRHLRRSESNGPSSVSEIELPDEAADECAFVQEAVRAYPELYFANAVVFGEGESEVAILKRLLEAGGYNPDAYLISVVPLGGRHVNHFWRLLTGLGIPYVTLLDLDKERNGGGWGRVKYALKQLLAIGVDKESLLAIHAKDGGTPVLSDERLEKMHTWRTSNSIDGWVERLEDHGVFFSSPLDVDFLMLEAFSDEYQATADGAQGPNIPEDETEYETALAAATTAVLKDADVSGDTYSDPQKRLFFWYRYLFLGRGKPATHILALSGIEDAELQDRAPEVLKRLSDKVSKMVAAPTEAL